MNNFKLNKSVVRFSKSQYDITTINNYFANKEIKINKENEKDLAKKIVNLVNNNIGNHANLQDILIKYVPNHHESVNSLREVIGKKPIDYKYDLYYFGGNGWEVRFHKEVK